MPLVPWAPNQIFQPNPRLIDLLRQQGTDAANAQLQQGHIQAQMWGNIGNTIAGIPGQIALSQRAASQQKLSDLAVKQATTADQTKTAFQQILKATPQVTVEAGGPYDVPAITKQLTDAGMDPTDVVSHLVTINGAFQSANAAKLALVQKGAAAVKAGGDDPVFANLFVDSLEKNGVYPPAQLQQFRDFIAADPGNTAKLTAYLAGPQKIGSLAPGAVPFNEATGKIVGPGNPAAPTAANLALQAAGGDPLKATKLLHPDAQPTEAGLAMKAAGGDVQAGAALTKMRPFVLGTPGSAEAFTTNARTIAEAKKGAPLTPPEIQAIDAEAVDAFRKLGKDPEAAALTNALKSVTLEAAKERLEKAQAGKPSTGAEKSTFAFFNRAKKADDELSQFEERVTKMGLGEQAWLKLAPNFLQSELGQQYTQAQRAFTEARLRKDSGAAIPEQEFENDRRTYFAQPGDTPTVAAQKARGRAAVLASLAFASGPALQEFYGEDGTALLNSYKARQGSPQAPTQAPAVKVPAAVSEALKDRPNGRRYEVGGTIYEKLEDGTIRPEAK